ncbi:hypothetical protein N0V90_009402 [Kalmusia sp. IMI 367209]|nr:hypothetical protein N0V90_009402 [Kalmusia sp. IMI 367209]
MRFPIHLSVPLLATAVLATPLPLQPRQDVNFTLVVSDFTAFMADPYVEGAQSNLSFKLTDPRQYYERSVNCVVPNTYFNLYAISALYDVCSPPELEFSYRFGEEGLTVRTRWRVWNATHVTSWGTQPWHWKEDGPGKNVTAFPEGKLYVRKEAWEIPILTNQLDERPDR